MRKGYFFTAMAFVITVTWWASLMAGCANIIPPAGGPKDTLPPRLIKSDPPDSTVNFNKNHITLTFDEYVDLQDLANNLIFTPSFENNPVLAVKGKTITIPFKDSLSRNTTYVLNFGNAITDMNERNVLRDFTYTFSTGPALDSLEISGRVILAETGGLDTTMIVVLHRKLNDSAVINSRPPYYTRLDRNGAFHFHNLPRDSFAIYALSSEGQSKQYTHPKTQLFAFSNTHVLAGHADSVVLYAYREEQGPATTSTATLPGLSNRNNNNLADRRLRFTPVTVGTQDLQTDYILNFAVPLKTLDTSKIHLSTDSSYTKTPHSVLLDSTKRELRIRTNWKENTRYNLVLEKDFASDTSNRQLLKEDTLSFTTKKLADYGKISIRLKNVDLSRNPVLLFIQNNNVVYSASVRSGTFSRDLFVPGDYELRILYDTNNNGKWDPGQFARKRQPELVRSIEQKITVKPNWENEYERGL